MGYHISSQNTYILCRNGKFSELPFRSSIEESNQTISFCGVGSNQQNTIFEIKNQTLTLGYKTLLWIYSLKSFSKQLNKLKVDKYGVITMYNVLGTTTEITLENNYTWGCPVYVLNENL